MRTLLLLVVAVATTRADETSNGFVPLFNGKDLTGWEMKQSKGDIKDFWSVKEGGILAAKAGTGWLSTTKEYGDFVLRVEWKIFEGGNSGVFIRVPGVKEGVSPSATGAEIQILDDNAAKYKGKLKDYQYSGSIYTFVPCGKPVFKGAGQWNTFEITCQGDHISVVYNGEKVAEADAGKIPELGKRPRKGLIGLQNHGSPVEFRKVEIKVLDSSKR
jgi:hypothetical protein